MSGIVIVATHSTLARSSPLAMSKAQRGAGGAKSDQIMQGKRARLALTYSQPKFDVELAGAASAWMERLAWVARPQDRYADETTGIDWHSVSFVCLASGPPHPAYRHPYCQCYQCSRHFVHHRCSLPYHCHWKSLRNLKRSSMLLRQKDASHYCLWSCALNLDKP